MAAYRSSSSDGEWSDDRSSSDSTSYAYVKRRRCPHAATYVLVIANIASFVSMLYLQKEPWSLEPLQQNPFLGPRTDVLLQFGGLLPREAREQGEWWRLASCCFVHAGVVHLVLNMVALRQMGCGIEEMFGCCRMVLVYMGSGIFGSICSSLFSEDKVSVGASGAILGLFGGFWSTLLHGSCYEGYGQCCRHCCALACNTAFIIILSLLPVADVWAHLGGLVMGFLLGNVFLIRELGDDHPIRKRQCLLATISSVFVLAAYVAAAVAYSQDADMYAIWPAAQNLNCFDTPLWRCCQFAPVTCAVAKMQDGAGNVQYWLECNPNSTTPGTPVSITSSESLHGPYNDQPDRCNCVEVCGTG
eukprot:TRINITY_DN79696_c0_g1_i1.p1 TRINITY_DN79696_c0_g1~~TRINITY_DN79696_c0_g1_i1.p1  ORF type:complete len:359 (+),score=39.21 TRINITY_DN79696_c0_g1_i1:27-1103(+)